MDKWRFVLDSFNDNKGTKHQRGSIMTPDGFYFCAVESRCTVDDTRQADLDLVEQVVKILNRELPGGKPRNRKGKK